MCTREVRHRSDAGPREVWIERSARYAPTISVGPCRDGVVRGAWWVWGGLERGTVSRRNLNGVTGWTSTVDRIVLTAALRSRYASGMSALARTRVSLLTMTMRS